MPAKKEQTAKSQTEEKKIQLILDYLEKQRNLKIQELKYYETPITEDTKIKEVHAMIKRNALYDLEGYIEVIKILIGNQ